MQILRVYFGSWLSQMTNVNIDSHKSQLNPKLDDWLVIQCVPVILLYVLPEKSVILC